MFGLLIRGGFCFFLCFGSMDLGVAGGFELVLCLCVVSRAVLWRGRRGMSVWRERRGCKVCDSVHLSAGFTNSMSRTSGSSRRRLESLTNDDDDDDDT